MKNDHRCFYDHYGECGVCRRLSEESNQRHARIASEELAWIEGEELAFIGEPLSFQDIAALRRDIVRAQQLPETWECPSEEGGVW